jgi:hypothetical protein
VDAHRSLGLVVSKYSPHGPDGLTYVDSRFYSTRMKNAVSSQ